MAHPDYSAALATAQRELAGLEAEKKRIEAEIMSRRRTIASLMELVKDSDIKKEVARAWTGYVLEQSITEDVRKIVYAAGSEGILKEGIRLELSKLGNSIENHSNPAGTINSIVKRLVDQGEVEERRHALTGSKTIHWKRDDPLAGLARPSFQQLSGISPLTRKPKK
jgi:hypothetical protein